MKTITHHLQIVLTFVIITFLSVQKNKAQPFVEQTAISLTGVFYGSVAWGDYDNDGDLDIMLTGSTGTGRISKIYRNNGNGTFTEQTGISLTGVSGSSVAWGDYDNDGDLDILLTGYLGTSRISKIYLNNGNNTFTEQTGISLIGVSFGSANFGDYNNDGLLDIFLTGSSTSKDTSIIYRNNGNNTFSVQTGVSIPGVGDIRAGSSSGDYDNDGDLDILLTGRTDNGYISKIYRNNGDGTFSNQAGISLTGVQWSSVAWGDYDNDGDFDILMSGWATTSSSLSRVYNNNGNNTFSAQTGISLTNVNESSVIWGDYDNDGDLDILLTGLSGSTPVSKVYKNNGNNTFTEQTSIVFTGLCRGSAAWGDYDNDGDLDILLTGQNVNGSYLSKIYRNDITTPNSAPTAPASVETIVNDSIVTLKWNAVKTDVTPYKGMTYNVRVGNTSGASNIVSPQSAANGYRLVSAMGNAQLDTFFILKNLPIGIYYWSVQAVDNGFMGGPFATEGIFTIGFVDAPTNSIVNDTANTFDWLNNPDYTAIADYEFSIDNGTTWNTCTTKPLNIGNVNLAAGYVQVRVKATTTNLASDALASNKAFFNVADAPTNPLVNDTTNTFDWLNNPNFNAIADYEYSIDNGTTWNTCTTKPINIGNVSLAVGYVQVRVKATVTNFASEPLSSANAFNINTSTKYQQASKIEVYPNPVIDNLYIKNYKSSGAFAMIFDLQGKLCISTQMNGNSIDVSNLSKGIYYVKIINSKNIIVHKFIKE